MKLIKWHFLIYAGLLFTIIMLNACKSIKNLSTIPSPWSGSAVTGEPVKNDPSKPNVFIVADYKLTELFDMLAPFYLFSATQKANVYIVAANSNPILIKRDLFVRPQLTFEQVDALKFKADVIVIPALSVRSAQQDTAVVSWITRHSAADTKLLSICDGASTAAATGLYDGKPITCHASDFAGIKANFSEPQWIQNVSVAESGRLYSTAGVSNAVEGSLVVIEDMFGTDVARLLMREIHYPYPEIKREHNSVAVTSRNKATAFKKIIFRKNKNLAFLLDNGIDEFQFASVVDTYGRTFPSAMTMSIPNDSIVRSKFGLQFIYTGGTPAHSIDEVHVLKPAMIAQLPGISKKTKIIAYDMQESEYPIEACLKRISDQYGNSFTRLVKVSLDYN